MAPDERRAALVEAVLPLLREHGLEVSTRQIAEAAGVAEGTIFRVFPDKRALICAAVRHAMDPLPTIAALRGIDTGLDLRTRLTQAADIITRRARANASMLATLRELPHHGQPPPDGPPAAVRDAFDAIVSALTYLIEPDREALRRSPESTARWFAATVITTTRMPFAEPVDPDEIVTLLLDGVLSRPPDPAKGTAC